MATTKVIKDLTEFNPGNPDYVLNATNAVTVINAGGNQYNFNGVYGKFGLRIGTTVLTGVPSGHPFAVLNNGLTGITYTGTVNEGTLAVGGFTYTFYSGDITITVTADFGVASYYCKIHGYMGGENNFVSVYSEAGLRMPTGGAFSGTPAEGMMRNDTTQASEGSASTMQHYNGTDWKNFVNLNVPLVVDYMVVGGGGSGGIGSGGGPGGGAGGLRTTTTYSGSETPLSATLGTAYTVVVGAGALVSTGNGLNGADSKFGTVGSEIISTGGGGGIDTGNGSAGGSGGGAGNANGSVSGIGGAAGSSGQGNAGGNAARIGTNDGNNAGGGGGGAGAAGGNASSGVGGNGGAGLEVNIIGGSGNYYAGGGGGVCRADLTEGTGGIGGGGAGGWPYGNPGTINTGGGGGGGRSSGTLGTGGSGTVILRYPTSGVSSHLVTGTLDTVTDTSFPVTNNGLYTFNGNALDTTSNGYNGTVRGITYTTGQFSTAATFAGGTDTNASTGSQIYISNSVWGATKHTFSVSLWFKGSTSPGEIPLIGNGGTIGGQTGFMVYTTSNGNLNGTFMTNGSAIYFGNTTNISDNQWHHVALTMNNGPYVLYLDGLVNDSGNSSYYINNPTPTYETFIGNRFNRNENGVLNGQIDQVRIFNSVLSSANITSLYNEGAINETTDGTDSILQFTGGTGTVTFS